MKVRPAVVLIQNDCVLTMRYQYGQTTIYNLPGGNPDPNETLPTTIQRELIEEMGITVSTSKLLIAGQVILPEHKIDVLHCVFLGQIESGNAQLNPAETSAQAIVWQPINELDALNMYPNVGVQLKAILLEQSTEVYIGKINQPWFV
jgi:8-oxo-dGTP pyrophosphatase MutT (NUDIX family)